MLKKEKVDYPPLKKSECTNNSNLNNDLIKWHVIKTNEQTMKQKDRHPGP